MACKTTDDIISRLFHDLTAEGFKASWTHPTYQSLPASKRKMYIKGLQIPRLSPFDLAYVDIFLTGDIIHCSLVFIYKEPFEHCSTKAECKKIVTQTLSGWQDPFDRLFCNIIRYFELNWAIEADEPESDDEGFSLISYLEGQFDSQASVRVRTLMLELREQIRF
ncbi:MAG: hypothetical protein HZA17_02455 [Nitrospirae bacterium]|nr:hypothetical protein [Nitrospirota bacterium]